jgi:hypothetical protein
VAIAYARSNNGGWLQTACASACRTVIACVILARSGYLRFHEQLFPGEHAKPALSTTVYVSAAERGRVCGRRCDQPIAPLLIEHQDRPDDRSVLLRQRPLAYRSVGTGLRCCAGYHPPSPRYPHRDVRPPRLKAAPISLLYPSVGSGLTCTSILPKLSPRSISAKAVGMVSRPWRMSSRYLILPAAIRGAT